MTAWDTGDEKARLKIIAFTIGAGLSVSNLTPWLFGPFRSAGFRVVQL